MVYSVPFLTPSRELALLLAMMEKKTPWSQLADEKRFARLVEKNRLLPLAAEQMDPLPGVEEDLIHQETWMTMQQVTLLAQLIRLFTRGGIPALAIKGPAMAMQIYGTPALRSCHDLDVLVPLDRLMDAAALLQADGWQWPEGKKLTTPKRLRESWYFWNHYQFFKGKFVLELHWRLLPWDCDRFDRLWQGRKYVLLGGEQIPVLSDLDRVYHQVVHNIRHGYHRLKWLADMIWLLPKCPVYMEDMWQQMQKEGQEEALLITWLLLLRLPGLPFSKVQFGPWKMEKGDNGVEVTGKNARKIRKFIRKTDELLALMEYAEDAEESRQYLAYRKGVPRPMTEQNILRRWVNRMRSGPLQWEWVNLPDKLYWLYWLLRPVEKIWRTVLKRDKNTLDKQKNA